MTTYLPVTDRIWVKPDKVGQTKGGLYMPDLEMKAGVPMNYFNCKGTVLKVGPGMPVPTGVGDGVGRLPMPCVEGDRILFTVAPRNLFEPEGPGRDGVVMIESAQVIAVIQGEPELN